MSLEVLKNILKYLINSKGDRKITATKENSGSKQQSYQ